MRTKTRGTVVNPLRAEQMSAEERANHEEKQAISAAIESRYRELLREQVRIPDADRRMTDSQCWAEAEREVHAVINADRRREARAALAADLRSAAWKNRHLGYPWKAAVPFALAGEAAAVASETGLVPEYAAVAAAAAAGGVTAGYLWRRIADMPIRYLSRFRAGIAAGVALCTAAPAIPWEADWHALLAAAGLITVSSASARYWRDNEPAYPTGDAEIALSDAAQDFIDAWDAFVGADGTHLPGSALRLIAPTENGFQFEITLVRGKQRQQHVRQRLADIAAALDVDESDISLEQGRTKQRVIMTVTTQLPDATYTGPKIVRDGSDVYIELGPYADGQGTALWHVLSGQLSDTAYRKALRENPAAVSGSAQGGFILGNKGSGKSRTLENVALGLRELGIPTIFIDPQSGASSPILMEYATWGLRGLDTAEEANGNILDVWRALKEIVDARQDENAVAGFTGFQHTPERPAIAVIAEECHQVFGEENPETGNTFGEDFGELDRIARKLGILFIGASQDPTNRTFGGSLVLRRGMSDANSLAMRYTGNNAGLVIASYDGQPLAELPKNRGYGYLTTGDRPRVKLQNRYIPDLRPFFKALPDPVLDQVSANAAGEVFLNRHERAEQDLAAVRARVEARRAGTYVPKSPASTSEESGVNVLSFPVGKGRRRSTEDEQESPVKVTPAQQRVLDALSETSLTASQVGGALDISREAASKHLRALKGRNLVGQLEDGRWMTKA